MDTRIMREIVEKKRLASKLADLQAQRLVERECETTEELYVKQQLGEPMS